MENSRAYIFLYWTLNQSQIILSVSLFQCKHNKNAKQIRLDSNCRHSIKSVFETCHKSPGSDEHRKTIRICIYVKASFRSFRCTGWGMYIQMERKEFRNFFHSEAPVTKKATNEIDWHVHLCPNAPTQTHMECSLISSYWENLMEWNGKKTCVHHWNEWFSKCCK